MHAEAAWDIAQLQMAPDGQFRPTLVIMTVEPGAVEAFAADAIGSRFDVIAMPSSKYTASSDHHDSFMMDDFLAGASDGKVAR